MIKYIIVGLLVITLISQGCKKTVEENKTGNTMEYIPPANTNLPLDSTDYLVISSAISQYLYPPAEFKQRAHIFAPAGAPNLSAQVFMADSTKFNPPPKNVTDTHRRLDPTDSAMNQWLITVNQNGYSIEGTRLFSELTVNVKPETNIKENSGELKKIYSAFPNGVMYVSKPAYSDKKMRAVVYFRVSGKGNDKEGLIWLRNASPVWSAYDIVKY